MCSRLLPVTAYGAFSSQNTTAPSHGLRFTEKGPTPFASSYWVMLHASACKQHLLTARVRVCSAVRPAAAAARPAGAMSASAPRPAGPATTAVDRKYQAFLAEMSELGAV